MSTNSILDILSTRNTVKLFLTELSLPDTENADGPSTDQIAILKTFGLNPLSVGTSAAHKLYRVLGTKKDQLHCQSMRLFLTNIPTVAEEFLCEGNPVVSLLLPANTESPFLDLGHPGFPIGELADDEYGDFEAAGYRSHLAINNRALIDLHLIWRGDTHQQPQEDFVRNGETYERKSKNIDYQAKAKFFIEFYQNARGQRGRKIGDQTIKVRGRKDIDLIVTNIDGGRKELSYIDWTGAVIFIGTILLRIDASINDNEEHED